MYCRKCGSELPDNALFCLSCGAKTNEEQPQSKVKKGFIIGALVFAVCSLLLCLLAVAFSFSKDLYRFTLINTLVITVFCILQILFILKADKNNSKLLMIPVCGFILLDIIYWGGLQGCIYYENRLGITMTDPFIYICGISLIIFYFLTTFSAGYKRRVFSILSAVVFIYFIIRWNVLITDFCHRWKINAAISELFHFSSPFYRVILNRMIPIFIRGAFYLSCTLISLGIGFSDKIIKKPKKVRYYPEINDVPVQDAEVSQESEQTTSTSAPAPSAYPPMPGDAKSTGLAVLCFFFPMIGLILWLVWKDQYPLKASSCSKGAIIGVIVYVLLVIAVYSLEFIVIYNIWH
jgi:hypothetical protein